MHEPLKAAFMRTGIQAVTNGLAPGLADGQGIAAVSVLLYWTGWNSGVNSSRRDCDLWMNPRGSGTPRSVCAHGLAHARAGIALKGLWPKDKSTLDKVRLEASVAVDEVHAAADDEVQNFLAASLAVQLCLGQRISQEMRDPFPGQYENHDDGSLTVVSCTLTYQAQQLFLITTSSYHLEESFCLFFDKCRKHTLHQLRCPSLDTLQHLNVSLVVRGQKLNTVFEVWPHQCRVQGHNHFPSPAGHATPDTSQDAIGFLGHLGTLLAHVQPAVKQHPQVLFHWAAFQPLFPKPVALHGVVVTQVQDPALGLVEPHTTDLGPLIQPVQVPLQSLPTLKQTNAPAQFGVICKLTEGALNPFVQIIDKDIKQDWPQN
ncbi:hypothetical protein QYF61_017149 [Mycteria americana]|uniref:Uncharacterized protein n=1 Tax=Mycteria americana TaxID=33587 RepID=A0AAN7P266_MYCAM|nr:hypothetical protein QYF61_017149 [Mycteria americana]